MGEFSHFDKDGNAVMVDVTGKNETERIAVAVGSIHVNDEIINGIMNGTIEKGDVLGVARVSGIMGAKRTSELIPMCHILMITGCSVDFECIKDDNVIEAVCTVRTTGRTGVEMEALTGVQIALLTIYDMCKAIDKSMYITDVHLVSKSGGKSGDFHWKE